MFYMTSLGLWRCWLRSNIISKIIESIRYKAALVITEVIKGSSREKPDHEVGLQHLHNMRWMRYFCLFYKDFQIRLLKYAHSFIPLDFPQDNQIHLLLL